MTEPIDFRVLVDRAALRVEHEDGVLVDQDARAVLVERALEHEAEVYQALRRENLGERDLEHAAMAQLREAVKVQRTTEGDSVLAFVSPIGRAKRGGPRRIDAAAVQQGMRFECHWVGWC